MGMQAPDKWLYAHCSADCSVDFRLRPGMALPGRHRVFSAAAAGARRMGRGRCLWRLVALDAGDFVAQQGAIRQEHGFPLIAMAGLLVRRGRWLRRVQPVAQGAGDTPRHILGATVAPQARDELLQKVGGQLIRAFAAGAYQVRRPRRA
jgi:hypothetical protein